VQEGEFARYVPTGHLIYGLPRSGVFAAPFDPVRGELTGAPVALGDWGLPGPFGWRVAAFDASRTGHLAYLSTTADAGARLEVWVDRDGRETPLPMAPGRYAFPALSPDGGQLAVTVGESGSPRTDIWLHDLRTGGATRLTFDGTSSSPVWTADGRGLAFASVASNLFLRAADGTAEPRRLSTSENPQFPYAWFDRDTRLLFAELTPDTALDVAVLDTADGGVVRPLVASPANETRPALSPDERWLAYTSDESGRPEVYIRPFPDVETGRWQVSTEGGHSPLWTNGGSELVFRGSGRMMAVEVSRGASLRLGTPRPLFEDVYVDEPGGRSYDVAQDGHRFLMLKQQTRAAAFDEIHVVVNWFEELEAQAPSR